MVAAGAVGMRGMEAGPMGCGTDVPAERAHALRASGRIDDGEYAAIVSADARFRREEVAWRAQLEAHYSQIGRAHV